MAFSLFRWNRIEEGRGGGGGERGRDAGLGGAACGEFARMRVRHILAYVTYTCMYNQF